MGINFLLLPGRFQGLNSGHQVWQHVPEPSHWPPYRLLLSDQPISNLLNASTDFLFCSVSFSLEEGLTHMVVRRRTYLLTLWDTWPTFGSQISVFSYDK